MKLFANRPLCLACTAALIVSFFAAYMNIYAGAAVAVLILSVSLFLILRRGCDRRGAAVVCIACALMLGSCLVYRALTPAAESASDTAAKGYLLPGGDGYERICVITELDGKAVNVRAAAYCPDLYAPDYSEFEAALSLSPCGGADAARYKSKGVFYTAWFSSFETTGELHKDPTYYANLLRRKAADRFYLISDNAGIICRVFLGIRDDTPKGFSSDINRLGVSHLLAVSGLHVTALLFGAEYVLRKISGKNRVNYIIMSVLALLYAAVTGFTGSVVRAAIMYLMSRASLVFKRDNDSVTSLLFAAFVIILVNPPSAFDTGFLLSFTATLGIIAAGAPASKFVLSKLNKKLAFLGKPLSALIITLSALIFTLPVQAYSGGKLAYGALLYNLLTVPVVTVLLYLCPYALILSFVPFLGRGAGLLCDGLCGLLTKLASVLAGTAPPAVSVSYPFVFPLIAVFAALAAVLAIFSRKRIHYLCLCLAFIIIFSSFALIFTLTARQKTAIIISPGKKGDYAAIIKDGECTVFDFTDGSPDGFYPLCGKLLSLGYTRAALVCAGEPDAGSMQNALYLCTRFDFDEIRAPEKLCPYLSDMSGISVSPYGENGDEIGGAKLTIIGGSRFVSTDGAVFCAEADPVTAQYALRFGKIIYGSAADGEKRLPRNDGTVFVEYNEGLITIYADD